MDHLRKSPVPLYYQAMERLRTMIQSGSWAPGARIPSERELMAEFGVGRVTVRSAIRELVAEGLLTTHQGKGVFVTRPKLEQPLRGFYSFTDTMRSLGLTPRSQILEVSEVPAPPAVAHSLGLSPSARVISLVRLRLASEEPIMFETSWLPAGRFPGLAGENLSAMPLYDVLQGKYEVRLVKAREYFEPVIVTAQEAKVLGVRRGAPALLLVRTTFDAAGLPVEYTKGVMRGDRCRYYAELYNSDPGPGGSDD